MAKNGSTFREKICMLFHDEFVSVSLPRQLVIQNSRLGIMFKFLQLVFLLVMLFYCLSGEVWRRPSPASPWGFSAWTEGPRANTSLRPTAAHCTDSQSYHYNFSRQLQLRPSGCRALSVEEASAKSGSGGEVFITTFTQERAAWHGSGSACGAAARQACEGSVLAGSYTASGGSCSCTTQEEYFAQDPEEQQIVFSHGYEVDTSNGQGLQIIRGSSLSSRVQEGPRGQMLEREDQMTTIFQRSDGSPCQVGGKSEWSTAASLNGISGTLREFLDCAGLTLDTNPRSLLAASGLAPHARTMGLSLELQLDYQNSIWSPGVICYVRVVAVPVWTWKQTTDVVRLPISGGQLAKQSRQVYGVVVSMKAAGQFYTFDVFKLITAIASLLVMLQVPRWITQFVALYCLGLMSNIYRNAKRAKLNIFEHFHGACARMMLAEIGFRGLMGGIWNGRVADMPGLTERQLHRQLVSIFHEHIENGTLQSDELRRMANVIFSKMDADKTGAISCSDYINSCTANDTIDLHSMARFFDDDKKVGFVQSYFDDTDDMRRNTCDDRALQDFNETDEEEGGMDYFDGRRRSVGSLRSGSSVQRLSKGSRGSRGSQARSGPVVSGILEADDVRELVAQGLENFDQRLKLLEKLSVAYQLEELDRKVDAASARAAQASRFAMRTRTDSDVQQAISSKSAQGAEMGAAVDGTVLSTLSSRVQQLEEGINLVHSNLEARTSQLEDVALREAHTDLKQDAAEMRNAFDERLRRIEAVMSQSLGSTVPPIPPALPIPPSTSPTWNSPRDSVQANSQADHIDQENRVKPPAHTQGKLSMPGMEDRAKKDHVEKPHPCFAKSLMRTPPGSPSPGTPAARTKQGEGEGDGIGSGGGRPKARPRKWFVEHVPSS